MGKKPVVGLIGLVWAGIALTGCGDCCRSNRNKYTPPPPPTIKSTSSDPGAPIVPANANAIGSATNPNDGKVAPPAKPLVDASPSGMMGGAALPASGTGEITTTSGTMPSPNAPRTQQSLMQRDETVGFSQQTSPPRGIEGSLPNQDGSRSADPGRMRMPSPPISAGRQGGFDNAGNPGNPMASSAAPFTQQRIGPPMQPGGQPLPPIGSTASTPQTSAPPPGPVPSTMDASPPGGGGMPGYMKDQ